MTTHNAAVAHLARAAAIVGTYCDHAEHLEDADVDDVRTAGGLLVLASYAMAGSKGPLELYAQRLEVIEDANVNSTAERPTGADAIRGAGTWREVQAAQIVHDRSFHPDVVGLAKIDQLRHYAFHLAKFPLVALAPPDQWPWRRVADMVLFGVKLQTVTNRTLPIEDVEAAEPPGWVQHPS